MAKVAILMGSETDRDTMAAAGPYLDHFGIEYEVHVLSAHRTPEKVAEFATAARANGFGVLIGGAGMAAHLAGALKAHSSLPVIGVPLAGGIQDGLDALLSTVQMPKGVPVATVAVGKAGAVNAAVLAAEILSVADAALAEKLDQFKAAGAKL